MELHQINAAEIKNWEPAKLRETATEIRRELANIRMDIYTARSQYAGKIRGLRKSLARVLTVANAGPKPVAAKASAPKVAKSKKASGSTKSSKGGKK